MTSPGPGQPIDVAYVEIVPDTTLFVTRLRRQAKEAFDDFEKVAERAAENVEKDLGDAANDISEAFDKSSETVAKELGELADAGAAAAEKIETEFDQATKGLVRDANGRLRDVNGRFVKLGDTIEDAFEQGSESGKTFNRLLSTLGESVVSIGSALVGLGASAPTPAGIIAIGAALAAIAALTPLILALAAALADLIGLIAVAPAGLAVLAAIIAPLVIAFQGFGDAIGAVIEKDPKKIAEALEGLAPAARGVVKEFQKLLPQFEQLGDIVQQAFFAQLQGSLTAVTNALLPSLTAGLARVADALGDAGAAFATFLSSAGTRNTLTAVFASAEAVIRTLTPSVIRLFDVLNSAVVAGLPFVEKITAAFGSLLDSFSATLGQSIESGGFQDFLQDALDTVEELFDLGAALGNLFVAVFGGLDDSGRGFLGTLTDLVDRMTAFFESAEGKDLIADLAEGIPRIAAAIGGLVNAFIFVLDVIGDFDDAVVAHHDQIVGFFNGIGAAISVFVSSVGAFFAALPGQIVSALAALPGLVINFFNFLFDQLFTAIGRGIGILVFTFTQLPGLLLAALAALPGVLLNVFQTALTNVTSFVVTSLNFLVQVIPQLLGQAVEFGRNVIVNGFNNIVEFIRSVPGRIRDAFLGAGSLVVSIGAAIGNALKTVINRAIDRINEGIAQVDNVLPGSLPRIPRLAHGGVATQETLAQIGEQGRAEGVIPLEDSRAMRMIGEAIANAGGGGGGPLFGPGSIVVSFDGVMPTDGQARQVGQNVGEGIASALTRRGIKLQVRAV